MPRETASEVSKQENAEGGLAHSGNSADRYGLATPLWIAAGGAIAVVLACLFMRETAPRNLRNASPDFALSHSR